MWLRFIPRPMAIVLLLVALAEPVYHRVTSAISVTYLLDVSESVDPASIADTTQWIRHVNETAQISDWRIIRFAANFAEPVDPTGTNIEDALREAIRSFEPHRLKRVVLISDGNENIGRVSALTEQLKAEHIRVFTVPAQSRSGDTWIENIVAPDRVVAGETFPLTVQIQSQRETGANVTLHYGNNDLGARKVQLHEGGNHIEFEPRLPQAGALAITARVSIPDDPFPENNVLTTALSAAPRPRILYVEGSGGSSDYLKDALTHEDIDVFTASPDRLPASIRQAGSFDAIVLSDVDREWLNDSQMRAIDTFVHDDGGGLIFAGGEHVYGEGGYSATPLERVLPVTFDARKPPETVSMVIVLDKSGSMEGLKIEMAKEATKAPLEYLKAKDKFGVVVFDNYNFWAVDFNPVDSPKMIPAIRGISAYGDTDIFPALQEAYRKLAMDDAESKHVLLLSDGISKNGNFKRLVEQMVASKITVSTVAVGEDADRELLRNIAIWGNGRAYYCEDPNSIPQVFIEESELATGKSLREEPFQPVMKKEIEAFKGIDLERAPNLRGYITTAAKPTAEVVLESPSSDPLLARWQYGLGKAVVFTSDVNDRWSVEWLLWDGYAKFWSQLVRQTIRRRDDATFDIRVEREGDQARITMAAVQKDGSSQNMANPQVRVIGPDQTVKVVDVPQVGPGQYQTVVALLRKGPYLFRGAGSAAGAASQLLPAVYPAEYHFDAPDIAKLQVISAETGGVFEPKPSDIAESHGETVPAPVPLWPYCVAAALMLYIGDVFVRRMWRS